MIMIPVCILGILVILFGIWALISSGKIRTYEGDKSLSEKFVMDINGVANGFFINSRDTDAPVLLLVSSGPGTDDYFLTDKYEDMRIEDDFTIVYWDYRGMGIAYSDDTDTESITMEALVSDAHEVTAYLKERFGKDRIYIMGFSGGSHIALRTVQQYPEDYIAYIGMAQVVTDSTERDTLMYDYMSGKFTQRGDQGALRRLESYVEHVDEKTVRCTAGWPEYVDLLHEAGGGTIKDKSEFEGIVLPILMCRCYTISEKIAYIKGMKMYRNTPMAEETKGFDYRTLIPQLSVPVYFISGEDDYNCPWPLVEEYCESLSAPKKEFFLVPDAAHSPLWENPARTCDILRQIKEETD